MNIQESSYLQFQVQIIFIKKKRMSPMKATRTFCASNNHVNAADGPVNNGKY